MSKVSTTQLSEAEQADCKAIIAACEKLPRRWHTLLAVDAALLTNPTAIQLAALDVARRYVRDEATDGEAHAAFITVNEGTAATDSRFRDRAVRMAVRAAYRDKSQGWAHGACNEVPFTARTLQEREQLHATIAGLAMAYVDLAAC